MENIPIIVIEDAYAIAIPILGEGIIDSESNEETKYGDAENNENQINIIRIDDIIQNIRLCYIQIDLVEAFTKEVNEKTNIALCINLLNLILNICFGILIIILYSVIFYPKN